MTVAARDVLRKLSTLGARIECRGERLVLRAGARRVPPELVAAAREVKADLTKVLSLAEDVQQREGERLRQTDAKKSRVSPGSVEGAHLAEDERLRAELSNFGKAEDIRDILSDPSAKMLIEGAQLSTFDKAEVTCGFRGVSPPKALNSPRLSTFGQDEHLWRRAEAARAATVERDRLIPRAWTEGIARLDPDWPPERVPLKHWQRAIDDIRRFLARWGVQAAELGWSAEDLFGADADRPEITWLNSGPLWSATGVRVIDLDADRIVFEAKSGAWLTVHRQPHLRARVLPWNLPL